jgi:hypothetical protein
MGIKQLNSFLKTECESAVHCTNLSIAANKTIVVDTSIYMYEFCRKGLFLEGFQSLLELFQEYEISPIFIFDGQMPAEKKPVIKQRIKLRKQAMQELEQLTSQLVEYANVPDSDPDKVEMLSRRQKLVSQSVTVSSEQTAELQLWMKTRQISFQIANGEADIVCAQMVLSNQAWGCMSNDTDLFMYTCSHILSNVVIFGENRGECYYFCRDEILDHLNMDGHSFTQLLVLSGSEYTPHMNRLNIYKIYRKWPAYLAYRQRFYSKWMGPVIPFCIWYQRYLKFTEENANLEFIDHIKAYYKIVGIMSKSNPEVKIT